MKTNKNKPLNPGKKHLLFYSGLFLALFCLTAGTTYFMLPRNGVAEDEDVVDTDDDDGIGGTKLTGMQRFVSNLTNSATSGLNLEFGVLDAYFPGKGSKGNTIDAKGRRSPSRWMRSPSTASASASKPSSTTTATTGS